MFEKVIEELNKNGFAIIPNFLNETDVKELKDTVYNMVERMDVSVEKLATDSTVASVTSAQMNTSAHIEASDKIRFFFEKEAFDENGGLRMDKHRALFRMGFAMHCLDPTFKKLTFSEKVKTLVKELGYVKPRVAQSMYIFKNPEIGGEFIPHQDATYLHAVGDDLREVGLWFPMEDADEENGCLSFIPGSHKTGLHRQLVRNGAENDFVFTKDNPNYDDKDFVALPAKKGSCVVIDGLVVHKSAQNRSKKARPIYTFHLYDNSTCEWDKKNWLQPTPLNPFPALYAN